MSNENKGIALYDIYEHTLHNIELFPIKDQEEVLKNLKSAKSVINTVIKRERVEEILLPFLEGMEKGDIPFDALVLSGIYYNLKCSKNRSRKKLANDVKEFIMRNGQQIIAEVAREFGVSESDILHNGTDYEKYD